MTVVATYPDSTKTSLEQRLRARARERWPQIASLQIRHRGTFSYVDATLTDATTLKLCRLRYVGSASHWQFAIYRASHDDYDESVFFTGLPVGTCQDALDTACGLYLNDPTAWTRPPTNLRARPLSLQLLVGLQDRVRVDDQRGDHVPDLGQLVAGFEVAQPQRVLDLLNQLQVGRHSGGRIQPELDRRRGRGPPGWGRVLISAAGVWRGDAACPTALVSDLFIYSHKTREQP
jgi:hypothetical protein